MTRIDPFELWNDFKAWVNTQQGGFVPPQTKFMVMANLASLQLWKRWTAIAEKSQEIKDNLSPFLVSKNVITTQSNSYYAIVAPPKNYGRFATAKILLQKEDKVCVPDKTVEEGKCCNGNITGIKLKRVEELPENYYDNIVEAQIQLVDNQKWSGMLEHLTKFPTFEKPKMTEIDGKFKVAPREVSVVVFNYYTEPVDAVFGYAPVAGNVQTGSGGAITYNPNASTPFQWGKTVKTDLLDEIKKVYIGYIRDPLFQQITNAQKQQPV